jgi:hypothetical protein
MNKIKRRNGKISLFMMRFSSANDEISRVLKEVEEELKKSVDGYDKLCKFYCESPKEMTSDVFFCKILEFKI